MKGEKEFIIDYIPISAFDMDNISRKEVIIRNNKLNMFTLSLENVKSALISALVTAVLGMAGYVIGVGNIFNLDFHSLANIGVLSALTAIVSLLKNFLTTNNGAFMGVVQTK